MSFPMYTCKTTFTAYESPEGLEPNRQLQAENFKWDQNLPKRLTVLCVEKIAENWLGYPSVEELYNGDRDLFISILNTEVPLELLVNYIKSDVFWERNYKSRWKDLIVVSQDRQWMDVYIERHFSEFLENMHPKKYDPEKINFLVKLCGPYIKHLHIRSLIPADLPVQRTISPEMADLITSHGQSERKMSMIEKMNEPYTRDHISLHAAISSLVNLSELHITYQLKNIGVQYRKDQFQFTDNDAKSLSRGLDRLPNLKTLRITRSDLNCARTKYILKGLKETKRLECIDFSHCRIGDDGLLHISKYISKHEHIKGLILSDNSFGPTGVEGLAYALSQTDCEVKTLDLRLNTKMGSDGVAYIAIALARGCALTSINLSGCGIKPGPLAKLPAGVWSVTSQEHPPSCGDLLARAIGMAKTPLRSLDISVNDVGEQCGNAIANAICHSFIIDVNLKRSGMSSFAMAIGESAAAAQKLRRESERGVRFKRSAGKVLQARRIAKGMNIETDPLLLATKLSARPSIVSVTSEEGTHCIQAQPLPTDFGFVPSFKNPLPSSRASSITGPPTSRRSSHHQILEPLKNPLPSSRASSITGPPTSRRSSHHQILEPLKEIRRSALVRRGSDGSLLQSRGTESQRRITIFVDNFPDSDED